MTKRKKPKRKIGSQGPTPAWLELSIADRAKLKADIREGLPKARKLFKGLEPSQGFDLRHPERWSAAQLKKARDRITIVRSYESQPFIIKPARSKKQRKILQDATGQTRTDQKAYVFFNVQPNEKIRIMDGKVSTVRVKPDKTVSIQRNYLFRDYLDRDENPPSTFKEMAELTRRMLPDMPATMGGRKVQYGLYTVQNGVIGNLGTKKLLLDLLAQFYYQYDSPEKQATHKGFADSVVGWYMTGTNSQVLKLIQEKQQYKKFWKNNKLKFAKKPKRDARKKHVTSKKAIAKSIRKSLGVHAKRAVSSRK